MRAFITFVVVLLIGINATAQDSILIKKALKFQERINHEFHDSLKSPLTKEDFSKFKSLEFFPIDENFIITAEFVRTPAEAPFMMETTTDRQPVYVKYGEAIFKVNDEEFVLNIYQSQRLMTDPEYIDYLFLPFTDTSNGEESYTGGRYLDLQIPEGNTIVLDFNQAYNPYCAYSGRYSCPIPPKDNHISFSVLAGVKAYRHEKAKDGIAN